MPDKRLSVIIVNFKTRDILRACLRSIQDTCGGFSYEVLVVDNASSDGSIDMVRAEFPAVRLIVNKENAGFARANNQAVILSEAPSILFLNPDTVVLPGSVQKLLDFIETQKDAGIAGPKLYSSLSKDFHASVRIFTTPLNIFLSFLPTQRFVMSFYHGFLFNKNKTRRVDWLWGAALMVKRSVLDETGLFDERFFLYSEEEDLCLRAHRKGFNVYYCPDAEIVHFKGGSSKQNSEESNRLFWQSKVHFLQKYFSAGRLRRFKLYFGSLIRAKMFLKLTPKDHYHSEILKALNDL